MRRALLGCALLVGCGYDAVESVPVSQLDGTFFAASVQPVVARSCASLDCHGMDGRPLRLYSEDGLRRRDDLRGQPLSADELAWNVDAFEALDPEPPFVDDHIALRKPLELDAGGIHHVGGELWPSREHPEHRCLRTWLAGELDPAPCTAAR